MTRKDYVLIANVLAPLVTAGGMEGEVAGMIAVDFCTTLKRDNPNFDGAKFLKACGVK